MEKKKLNLANLGLILFTFLLIGQFIKETIYLIVFQGTIFTRLSSLEISSYFNNYYLIIIGIILGLGLIKLGGQKVTVKPS